MKKKSWAVATFCVLIVSFLVTGCGEKKIPASTFTSCQEFDQSGVKIGVAEGYVFQEAAERYLPNAEIVLFHSREDAFRALEYGDVDGVVDDEPVVRAILRSTDTIALTEGYLEPSDYSFAFTKNKEGERLAAEFSEYVKELQQSGEYRLLDEKWFGEDTENRKSSDIEKLDDRNGTLSLAFEDGSLPFAYLSNQKPTGYEIDLVIGFCQKYGYGLKVQETEFSSMLEGVSQGNYNMGCGAITITEERKEKLVFAVPDYSGGICVAKSTGKAAETENGAAGNFARHFKQAFLEGDRLELFLTGVLTTLILFFCSALFGTMFGMVLFVLSERGGPVIRWLAKGVAFILHSIPILMIMFSLYYSFYSRLFLGGLLTSIIGFTLYFGDEVCRLIRQEAERIDEGKLLRDYHLLAIDGKPFFRTLRKKSRPYLRRGFKEALITLLKFTSVVGYIGVLDLTKVFDEIRMASYEIILPLAFTTLIYFLLIRLISFLFRDRVSR